MTVFSPPPLPVKALPLEAEMAIRVPAARPKSGGRVGLVMMYLLCSGVPVIGATLYVWHRHITPDGNLFSGGVIHMVTRLIMYVIAALCGVMNCWHVIGGLVAACVYAWRGKANRTGFWVMGAGYGLLSGLLLLDAANGGIAPKMQPLYFPIPRMVAVWVVLAIGTSMTAGMLWAERAGEKSPAIYGRTSK